MNESALEISPPRRAFLYVFLITGIILLLNGFAVLFFAPIPRSPNTLQPAPLTHTFGLGGWMPILAGLLCLGGAGWMLNRHRQVARIAELVHADLPRSGVTPESRNRLLSALIERTSLLQTALVPFPQALVRISLRFGEIHRLDLDLASTGSVSGRFSPIDRKLGKAIDRVSECVVLNDEILVDFTNAAKAFEFFQTVTTDILRLPPDFELSGSIRMSRRHTTN